MEMFEIGRVLGRLEIILESVSSIENDLEELEDELRYNPNIISLAKICGRIEQKMINSNKSQNDIENLKEIFKDIEQKCINEFKKTPIEKLRLRGFPIKALNSNNIFTVEDLCNKSIKEIENINGISRFSVKILVDELNRNGIQLKK